jgi:hypothetical protein
MLGEALYRFLLSQSSAPPTYRLSIRGTHTEQKVRLSDSNTSHQRHHHRRNHRHDQIETEAYTEVVTDFDFAIDLTPNIITLPQHSPIQWSVSDDEPAYRGKMYQQIEAPFNLDGSTAKSRATKKQLKEYQAWCQERDAIGLPPWARTPTSPHNVSQLQSSRTVRQWCDDYCSSDKHLKEFVYTKVSLYVFNVRLVLLIYPVTGRIRLEFQAVDFRNQNTDC